MDQDSDDSRGSPFIVTPLDQTEKQPFLLFVVSSADLWSPATVNPSDADLAAQKMTRRDYMAFIKNHQTNETDQLAGIPGGSYRVMLFNLPDSSIEASPIKLCSTSLGTTKGLTSTISRLRRHTYWPSLTNISGETTRRFSIRKRQSIHGQRSSNFRHTN
jgi:hypothetical protein